MSKRVMASPFLRFGSFLLVAVLSLLVSEAEAGQRNAPSIIYWSIRQVRLLDTTEALYEVPYTLLSPGSGSDPILIQEYTDDANLFDPPEEETIALGTAGLC